MFTIDERLKGLPAVKEQVVQLYQSLNQPHLAVPGRRAGPASGYVLGLRGPSGFAVFVYLYMPDSGECAVYVPSSGTVAAEQYQSEEGEALGFVESMGFIMDNLNFRGRPIDEQDGLIRSLPVFQREPPPAGSAAGSTAAPGTQAGANKAGGVVTLGKLFSAFCLGLWLLGCAHVPSERDREQAQIHYDLAVQNLVGQPQAAYQEAEQALALNPQMHEAWHVKGLLLHHAFGRQDEALTAYLKSLELKPDFSEARTNLGNLYVDLKRYDDAIAQYDKALNDVLYGAPFIAHGNLGWAYYKKGDLAQALDHLKASVTINPKYCLGHLKLGQLYDEQQNVEESCKYFGRYREYCPERAEAWQYDGLCHAKKGEVAEATRSFDTCVEKATTDDQRDLCKQLKGQLAP